MSEYQREKRKVLILLGVGILLMIAFSLYGDTQLSIGDFFAGPEEILTFAAILCYPIGLFYGWRDIGNLYSRLRRGDRIGHINNVGYNTIMITAIWIGFAIAITFLFGWIFGTYKAIKKLRALKKAQ